ncbi:MAG: RNA polymerase sigma factor [Bacteroidota bacterium]
MEETLINKAIARDPGAIEALYDSFAPKFLSLCYRYCGNREDAEDILHDGFIKIIQNIHKFQVRSNGTLEAWMRRIIVNASLNFIRGRIKEQKIVDIDPLIDRIDLHDEAAFDPEEEYLMIEPDKIMALICELPAGYRTVFNMFVFERYGHKEIAEALGFSENTSKSQLSKARAFLRKKLNSLVNTEISLTR